MALDALPSLPSRGWSRVEPTMAYPWKCAFIEAFEGGIGTKFPNSTDIR